MKRLTTLMIAAAALALSAGAASAEGMKVKIATEGAYAPFNFVASDGSLQGFDVDIAKAVCEHMHAQCTIVAQDWEGIIPGLLAKKYDAIFASMSITDERKKKVNFSDKYYNTPAVLAGKPGLAVKLDANGYIDPASVKGMKIGVQRATIHEKFVRAKFPQAEPVVYDTADNANLDLAAGRIDLRMDDIVTLKDFMKSDQGKGLEIYGKGFTEPRDILGYGVGAAVRKQDKKLLQAINKAIKEIREDGTYKKINDKYFDFNVYGS